MQSNTDIRMTGKPSQTISQIFLVLLGLSIILLPFNDLPYFKVILREIASEGAYYPIFLGFVLWLFSILVTNEAIKIPFHVSAQLIYLFIAWVFISGLVNIWPIFTLQTKGRTGVEKFFLQNILFFIVLLSSFFVYKISRQNGRILIYVRRFVLISFLIAGTYSALELIYLLGSDWAASKLEPFNSFIHDLKENENLALYSGRLRSVSGEASWFAMYCSFILPWIFSYLFTERKRFWIYLGLLGYLLLMITLTWSRTAYVITLLQIILFLGFLIAAKRKTVKKNRIKFFVLVALSSIIFASVVFKDMIFEDKTVFNVVSSLTSSEDVSNIARAGSQAAAINMGLEHPFFGVGFGLYGFYMPEYVPTWAKSSDEIQEWMSGVAGTAWPPVHGLYARIMGELGLSGLFLWLSAWVVFLRACYVRYKMNCHYFQKNDTLGLALIVSACGVLLSGFNSDSFRFFGYWIILGLGWSYITGSEPSSPS